MNCIGIDVGGMSVKIAATEDGRPLWTGQSEFYCRPGTQQLIDAIRAAAAGRANEPAIVGICAPGLLDQNRRAITLAVNVPGLVGITLDELVAAALGQVVSRLEIINDAVASGTDVVRAKGLTQRVLAMALGTGVGMGVLDDGVPLMVEGSSPGHIGQVDVSLPDEAPVGPDGGAGSLEGYIGAPALIRRYGSVEQFLSTATITDAPLRALARALRICHAIYRPQHIVLLGGVGIRLQHLIAELKRLIDSNLTSVARPEWTLSAGQHDFHAAFGAARLAASLAVRSHA